MASLTVGLLAAAAAVAGVAVLAHRANMGAFIPPPMHGKTVLITGGTTGLGLESAKRLAKAGAKVIITARSDTKGQTAVQDIQDYCTGTDDGTVDVSYQILELDQLESTKAAAEWQIPTKIDVLMLNAGIMAPAKLQMSHLGVEQQMHTNHLGHFVLTASLLPFLNENARIVVVSSLAHTFPSYTGGLKLDQAWKPEPYIPVRSYGYSKLANVYFASQLNARSSYTAVSLHPGTVATDLARQITSYKPLQNFFSKTLVPISTSLGLLLTPAQGANTQVYLASTTDNLVGGGYYTGMKLQTLGGFATDPALGELLWKQSEEISGVKFQFDTAGAAKEAEAKATEATTAEEATDTKAATEEEATEATTTEEATEAATEEKEAAATTEAATTTEEATEATTAEEEATEETSTEEAAAAEE
ncbi:daunorubicin C-13 ketoreductase DnrU [Seminavis robusta]|uniref:Daunorubicin C-13 ketoreductase DnrU n=1 Tax=Seminavis robusta TaxID=568900 RepID=A0A9N8HHT9_9STRA|nr:daunorubicin C-13 ketoreductase DnrU [Seminavis robusta]|eukprot:Sro731_g194250.1 daunorubicin C-13 ketoreductase DnrU (417) ;mRNA; r:25310-26560